LQNRCLKQLKDSQNCKEIALALRQEEVNQVFLGPLETIEMTQNVYTLEEAIHTFESN
jgi:hypothetical protein